MLKQQRADKLWSEFIFCRTKIDVARLEREMLQCQLTGVPRAVRDSLWNLVRPEVCVDSIMLSKGSQDGGTSSLGSIEANPLVLLARDVRVELITGHMHAAHVAILHTSGHLADRMLARKRKTNGSSTRMILQ